MEECTFQPKVYKREDEWKGVVRAMKGK